MKQANQMEQQHPKMLSSRMAKLKILATQATLLNKGALKERVAVRDPNGGYVMVIREIKS